MLTKTYNLSPITFPRILLLDMNSFFASVEQQANPFLRGRPVGVVASHHDTSCLIAASKEAKAMGIQTGTLVYKAKRICPKIVLIKSEPQKYREVNRRIVKIFCDYTDRVEVYSIDEAFLDLSDPLLPLSPLHPLLIGAQIKKRIRQEIGDWLTCSVGIGQNKFLCKLAADLQKPDGLSIIWRENLSEIYKTKSLRDLWGISYGWERRLAKIGIISPLQLLNYPVQNLISLFGKPGYYLWERVNGLERDEIGGHPELVSGSIEMDSGSPDVASGMTQGPKSFGHSWVLNFRTTDKEKLKPVILRLAEKAARRMRAENFQAYGFYLSVRMVDGSSMGKSKKLKFPINTGLELYEQVMMIWKSWEFQTDVMHIAVGFTNLTHHSSQLELNYELRITNSQSAIRNKLIPSIDYINDKYGEFTVRSGLLAETQDYTPDAIAFGK